MAAHCATLRDDLVRTALSWQRRFGVAPAIISALSDYDAARLLGMTEDEYGETMSAATAVQRGYDFAFRGVRVQVKANRPSGKRGSTVTRVPKASNYEWDLLIWMLYDTGFNVVEAWQWTVAEYRAAFDSRSRLSPADYRRGRRLVP